MPPSLPELASTRECRQRAEDDARAGLLGSATVWALLAIAGELATIRRDLGARQAGRR